MKRFNKFTEHVYSFSEAEKTSIRSSAVCEKGSTRKEAKCI